MKVVVDKENVCWSKVGEDTLLVNLDTGFYYTLDELGGIIWMYLVDEKFEAEIAAEIASKYEVAEQKALEDCRILVKKLADERMVTIVES